MQITLIIAAIVAAALVIAAGYVAFDAYLVRVTGGARGWGHVARWREGRDAKRIGCTQGAGHSIGARHRPCARCATPTCGWLMAVDPDSLRRRQRYLCPDCYYHELRRPTDSEARIRRTRRDWEQLTDPIRHDLLTDAMTEQFPGRSRAAVRAFLDSGKAFATVEGADAGTLQATIGSLGLWDQVYAEQRGNTAVLRRITADEATG